MESPAANIIVLGASGLVGGFITGNLTGRGLNVVAVARRFTEAQRTRLGDTCRQLPIVGMDSAALSRLIQDNDADIVVNCIGVLQDAPGASADDTHHGFINRLLAACRSIPRPPLLIHLSIPGQDADDRTGFARSKRAADHAIAQSGLPHVILRPGFVFAPAAYGGSALLRALAALPFDLPRSLAARPFAIVAVEDIAETVAVLTQRWRQSNTNEPTSWDLMHPKAGTLGDAVANLRVWLGGTWPRRVQLPMPLMTLGAWAGDLAAWLGWRPPIRSTPLAELQRGVTGDPRAWMAASGITPRPLDTILRQSPATVQERWFARLYLLKALMLASLTVFWCASALIALTVAYPAAVTILTSHGYSDDSAQFMTIAGSAMDFCIGIAIAFRRTSRWGLAAGIAVSLFYMAAAAILTPELWIEPLGALVKTGPAIVLMLVALAISEDR